MKKVVLLIGVSFVSTTLSAAITSNFSGGDLDIATDAGDDIVLTVENGFVKLNGVDPDSGPLEAALVTAIDVSGDDGDNNFDFSAVTEANFPNFVSAEFDTEDGNDVLAATDFRDTIDLGEGIDQVTFFGDGFNLMDWERGYGTESFTFNDPDGVLRLRLQGSTSDDDIQFSASGNVVSLTDQISSETIQIENITDIALQLGDGDDVVTVSDLSSLTTREPILINKNNGSMNYSGGSSNYPVTLNVSSSNINVDAVVTPGQGSSFSRSTSFTSTPFVFNITKSGNTIQAIEQSFSNTCNLEGFTTINLGGTPKADTFNLLEDIGSSDLDTMRLSGSDGADVYNVVFQTSTELSINEISIHGGDDVLNVDAEGNPVTQGASFLESLTQFGRIGTSNVEVINITNAADLPANRWMVE